VKVSNTRVRQLSKNIIVVDGESPEFPKSGTDTNESLGISLDSKV